MQKLQGHSGPITCLAFSPHGDSLFSASTDRTLRCWPLDALEQSGGWGLCLYVTTAIAFGQRIPWLLTGDDTGHVQKYQIKNGGLVSDHFIVRSQPITGVVLCDNDRILAFAHGDVSDDRSTSYVEYGRLKDGPFGQLNTISRPHSICCLAATPGGKRIVYAGGNRRVVRWDLTSPDLKESVAHTKAIRCIALRSDGGQMAASDDYAIQIYDADSMQPLQRLVGHKGRVNSVAYLPDGRLLSGSWDNTVRLWDTTSGRELAAHDWQIGGIRAVAASPDGMLGAAGGDQGGIVLWDLDH